MLTWISLPRALVSNVICSSFRSCAVCACRRDKDNPRLLSPRDGIEVLIQLVEIRLGLPGCAVFDLGILAHPKIAYHREGSRAVSFSVQLLDLLVHFRIDVVGVFF